MDEWNGMEWNEGRGSEVGLFLREGTMGFDLTREWTWNREGMDKEEWNGMEWNGRKWRASQKAVAQPVYGQYRQLSAGVDGQFVPMCSRCASMVFAERCSTAAILPTEAPPM